MRRGIGKYIGGLALGAFFAFGAAAPAHAGGPECKTYNQAGSVSIALTANCTISGNVISTGGGVSVTGPYTFAVTGKITSGGGQDVYLNPNSINVTGVITSAGNVTATAANGDVTLGGAVTSAAGDYVYLWGNNITTKAVTAGGYLQATANGSGNTLAFNGAVKATNSYILLFGPTITASSTVSAGSYLQATATEKSIKLTGTVSSGTFNSQGGVVYLYAQTDVTTGAVDLVSTNAVANNAGFLDIHAWQGGGTVPLFTIGGSGLTNAINGTITMSTANGGGSDTFYGHGGVNVWNGVSGSAGASR